MITLYGRRNSSNVQRVTWALGELGLSYQRHAVGGSFGGGDAPEYLAMNPTGLVPTMRDATGPREIVLWESEAILRYLAARYGAGVLWPEDALDRAIGDQWLAWTAAQLNPAIFPVFHGSIRRPRAEQDLAALQTAAEPLRAAMRLLDAALAKGTPHLAGEAFSYADIPPAIQTFRYYALQIDRPELPALRAWFDRVSARPAFQEHVALEMGTCLEEWLVFEKTHG